MRTNRKKGFTITELVIVIAVIAVLAAVLIPTFASVVSSANESKAMQNCHNALTTYRASEGGGDVDPGMVLLNNEDDNTYAYVYLGGTLEKIDKIDKIAYFDGKSIDEKKKNEVEGKDKIEFSFKKEDGTALENGHSSENKLDWVVEKTVKETKDGKEVTSQQTVDSGSFSLKAEKNETAASTASVFDDLTNSLTGAEHNDLTLYFYSINVNGKDYVGWFTMETNKKEALLTLEEGAVVYSNNYGYIEVDDDTKIIFSEGDPIETKSEPEKEE